MTTPMITLDTVLNLVSVSYDTLSREFRVTKVKGNSLMVVDGDCGTVTGTVSGTINGREWQSMESPKEKLKRLIKVGACTEDLLDAFEEMEDS